MKITIMIHGYFKAEEIFNQTRRLWKDHFQHDLKNEGIYFHVYEGSEIPFYIGESVEMLQRNYDHIAEYRSGMRYWLPKHPEQLKNAECKTDNTYHKYEITDFYPPFSKPSRSLEDIEEQEKAAEGLFNNMRVYFCTLEFDKSDYTKNERKYFRRQAEFHLQQSLHDSKGIRKNEIGWFRRGDRKPDGCVSELVFQYAPNISRLDEVALGGVFIE